MIKAPSMKKQIPAPIRTPQRRSFSSDPELIDFDVIKGSSLFNTKPSKHNKELVRKSFYQLFFFPFYRKQWKQKLAYTNWEGLTLVYLLHCTAILVYFLFPQHTSRINTMEICLPVLLLIITAICYSRATALLVVSDPKTGRMVESPLKSDRREINRGLDTALLESDQDSSISSDSEDVDSEDGLTSPKSDDEQDDSSEQNLFTDHGNLERVGSFGDHFTRRRLNVCTWTEDGIPQKKSMSIAEVRSLILERVKSKPSRRTYRHYAMLSAITLSTIPIVYRLVEETIWEQCTASLSQDPKAVFETLKLLALTYGTREQMTRIASVSCFIAVVCCISTFVLASALFNALADAEVTYHRRMLYAKCFTALTSSRRAKAAGLPHFRLKNVVNIKAWLSLRGGRSWLKRQGRQRAADEIVSSSFLIFLVLLALMGMQVVAETTTLGLLHTEVTLWCLFSSIFLLRYMMLGSKINRKYQNTSLLLTEQLNLYLRLLLAPHKKDRLLISNNVLKLAMKLLKELHSPNKISGLTMNPLLYNITRVVVLSAFSAALSEIFGFKLKLWKLKSF